VTYRCSLHFGLTLEPLPLQACTAGAAGCPSLKELDSLEKHLVKEWHKQQEKDLRKALSLLFNTFIFCQVGQPVHVCHVPQDTAVMPATSTAREAYVKAKRMFQGARCTTLKLLARGAVALLAMSP
jgi:hypothetical protein